MRRREPHGRGGRPGGGGGPPAGAWGGWAAAAEDGAGQGGAFEGGCRPALFERMPPAFPILVSGVKNVVVWMLGFFLHGRNDTVFNLPNKMQPRQVRHMRNVQPKPKLEELKLQRKISLNRIGERHSHFYVNFSRQKPSVVMRVGANAQKWIVCKCHMRDTCFPDHSSSMCPP